MACTITLAFLCCRFYSVVCHNSTSLPSFLGVSSLFFFAFNNTFLLILMVHQMLTKITGIKFSWLMYIYFLPILTGKTNSYFIFTTINLKYVQVLLVFFHSLSTPSCFMIRLYGLLHGFHYQPLWLYTKLS